MKTVDIPERDTVISTDDEITYCVYTGALRCNLDDVCLDITAGGGSLPVIFTKPLKKVDLYFTCDRFFDTKLNRCPFDFSVHKEEL